MNILCMATDSCGFLKTLQGRFRSDFINLDCDTDYASIVTKAKNHKPDILLISYDDYIKNTFGMNLFREGTIFAIPEVWIACETMHQFDSKAVILGGTHLFDTQNQKEITLPSNFRLITVSEMLSNLTYLGEATGLSGRKDKIIVDGDMIESTTQQTLLDLGFNGCTYGTTYIRECIIGVMGINCQPQSLNSTIYSVVSQKNHTTLANLQRCTRTSLETAWKRRKKNVPRQENGVCFDDFTLCPSVKEFIYYVAYKLNNYLFDANFK